MKMTRIIAMMPVRNLAASIAFYGKLGFTVEQRNDDWGWAMLACGDCRLMLDRSINQHPSAPRQSVLYLYLDDIVAYHQQVRESGLAVPQPDKTFYDMTEFRVEDPDGNRLWIGQDKTAIADRR
jgi:catechol 2,3-dioxygenase-like lactoylglutathione lyase family enzyme